MLRIKIRHSLLKVPMEKMHFTKAAAGKAGRGAMAVLMTLILIFTMIPTPVSAASKTYELGQPAGWNDTYRTEIGGKYFTTKNNNNTISLWCSSTEDGKLTKVATQSYGYNIDQVLCNGSRVYYVYKTDTAPVIYSRTTSGKSLIKYTATKGPKWGAIWFVGVYNNYLYYAVGEGHTYKLARVNLTTKKVSTVKSTYNSWQRGMFDYAGGQGVFASSRYLYGYKSPKYYDTITVYDCKTKKTTTYKDKGQMLKVIGTKLYYYTTTYDSDYNSTKKVYVCDGTTGKNKKLLFKGTSIAEFRIVSSKMMKYRTGTNSYYKYTFADKTSVPITKEQYYAPNSVSI